MCVVTLSRPMSAGHVACESCWEWAYLCPEITSVLGEVNAWRDTNARSFQVRSVPNKNAPSAFTVVERRGQEMTVLHCCVRFWNWCWSWCIYASQLSFPSVKNLLGARSESAISLGERCPVVSLLLSLSSAWRGPGSVWQCLRVEKGKRALDSVPTAALFHAHGLSCLHQSSGTFLQLSDFRALRRVLFSPSWGRQTV